MSFPGRVRDLSHLMKAAVAFILPSRYEGFPNVLLEALALGVPCWRPTVRVLHARFAGTEHTACSFRPRIGRH